MALGNIVATVLTTYKADTSDQRKELKKLKGAEKDRHQALIDQTEKQNKAMDDHIAMWGKVAIGVGAAAGAVALLANGFEVLQKDAALRSASVGVNLEGLRKSTRGLVTDTELLAFSSVAMNGTFKLSQTEMELALRGATALSKELGISMPKALEATKKSVVEGSVEPLVELGHVITGTPSGTQQGINAVLNDLAATTKSVGTTFDTTGEGVNQAAVEFANASLEMNKALGSIANALTPVIAGFASMLTGAIAAAKGASAALAGTAAQTRLQQLRKQERDLMGNGSTGRGARGIATDALFGALGAGGLNASGSFTGEFIAPTDRGAMQGSSLAVVQGLIAKEELALKLAEANASMAKAVQIANEAASRETAAKEAAEAAAAAAKEAAEAAAADKSGRKGKGGVATIGEDFSEWSFLAGGGSAIQAGGVTGDLALGDMARAPFASLDILGPITEQLAEVAELRGDKNILANLFGTPSEIDATATAIQALSTGVDAFSGAFGAGVSALIDGSKSFSDALKDALGQSLKAMAVDFSMQALRHTLYGLGAAIWNPAAAGAHFAAAAAFAGGAVVVGGVASQLGANTGSAGAGTRTRPGGSAGAGGVGNVRPGSGASNGNTRITIFDDDFASMSARERESRLRTRARSAGFDVNGDVVVNG